MQIRASGKIYGFMGDWWKCGRKERKGERMLTELLFWDKKKRNYTDRAVQIETDGQRITGVGFEADQEFNSYQIYKVQGEITIDDE